ncbi:MAG: transposase [Fermentimonas sp.]|nr:transposase [Fermentimonas sp.]
MAKLKFKSYNQGQVSLFPPTLDEKVPTNSPARIINQIVDNLDLSKVFDTYKGGVTTAYNPRMMLKVVLYGYLNNIYSSRKIEQAIIDRVSFYVALGQSNTQSQHDKPFSFIPFKRLDT